MPPDVREWLPPNHLAWFVIDAVGEMDLDAFYAVYRVDGRSQPPYDPAMMVALLLYAYARALMVSGYDLQWVMAQVGHADSDTTTKIYEQLQKRRNRDGYGAAFDAVVARAKELLGLSDSPLNSPSLAP